MTTQGPWFLVGPLLGLLVAAHLWATRRPLGAMGGYVEAHAWARGGFGAPGARVWFLLGIVLGGAAFQLAAGGAWPAGAAYGSFDEWTGGALATKAGILIGAGALMGFGAKSAGGCTSGHGLCGTALGSPGSFAATGTFMAVAVAVSLAATWLAGGAS